MSADEFFQSVLYDSKIGYYNSKNPLGLRGDFITSPKISRLFSEILAIWIISVWEVFGKPKNFNIIELGTGDGTLMKIFLEVFKRFPEFNNSKRIYLYELSTLIKKKQKKNLNLYEINWINDLNKIKKGPVFFRK